MRGMKLGNAVRAIVAAAFVLGAGVNGVARAAEGPIVLKAITPWAMSYYWCAPMAMFQKMVNSRLKGKVVVSYLGANEVVSRAVKILERRLDKLQIGPAQLLR